MKNDNLFKLKTLFDPLSSEWEDTNYEGKKKLIKNIFGKNEKINKNLSLEVFVSNAMFLNSDGNYVMPDIDEVVKLNVNNEPPLVTYYNLLLAVGFYLNKSIDKSFEFPDKISKAKWSFIELEELKDRRKKKTRFIHDTLHKNYNGNSRDLFDFPGAEGMSSKIESKIEKLKTLHESGAASIDVLFFHVYQYESMENYSHVVDEAPYSAFALCWDGNEFV